MNGDDFIDYMESNELTYKKASGVFGVSESTIKNWRNGVSRIPKMVQDTVYGDRKIIPYKNITRISYEQLCTTVYKLIQNMKDMELEITELRRVVQKENRYQNGMNLYQHKP